MELKKCLRIFKSNIYSFLYGQWDFVKGRFYYVILLLYAYKELRFKNTILADERPFLKYKQLVLQHLMDILNKRKKIWLSRFVTFSNLKYKVKTRISAEHFRGISKVIVLILVK